MTLELGMQEQGGEHVGGEAQSDEAHLGNNQNKEEIDHLGPLLLNGPVVIGSENNIRASQLHGTINLQVELPLALARKEIRSKRLEESWSVGESDSGVESCIPAQEAKGRTEESQ
ncbi:hypothetical protein RHMOL_Rhmol05G0069100 [Rhododendron molle]|uniref:Uncharacterized protein n=1 Tax=Rhododendron molle TaxID=49168 RepID=A0ACC0NMT2_RHOML|nr:hypothetical protein RHMOL_Rhmol05G0069100 [Rhododendron molle]